MYKHAGIRFKCYVHGCQQATTRKDNLIAHMRSHSLSPEETKDFMKKLNAFFEDLYIKFPGKQTRKKIA
jgi:phage FluMu gp28-like protein